MGILINDSSFRVATAGERSIRSARKYQHGDRVTALMSVELILQRGNAARMVNAAGNYIVTELVLQ